MRANAGLLGLGVKCSQFVCERALAFGWRAVDMGMYVFSCALDGDPAGLEKVITIFHNAQPR